MRLPFVALHSEMWKLIKRNQEVIPCSHKLSHTIISNPRLCWGQHHSAMIYSPAYWSSWFYHKGFYPASPTCPMLSVPHEQCLVSVISSICFGFCDLDSYSKPCDLRKLGCLPWSRSLTVDYLFTLSVSCLWINNERAWNRNYMFLINLPQITG